VFARESVFVLGRQLQLESRLSVGLLYSAANLVRLWAVFAEFWFFVDSFFTIPLEFLSCRPLVIEQQQAGELKGNFCNFAFPGKRPGDQSRADTFASPVRRNTRSDEVTTEQS